MKKTDIQKIRQSLKRIEKYYNDLNDDLYDELDKIRSLLPCETCGDGKTVPVDKGCIHNCVIDEPCPNCK